MGKNEVAEVVNEYKKIGARYNAGMFDDAIRLPNGLLFALFKRKIRTSFCYGYGWGVKQEDAEKSCDAIRQHDAFVAANLKDFDECLANPLRDEPVIYLLQESDGTQTVNVATLSVRRHFGRRVNVGQIGDAERAIIQELVAKARERFCKRLEAYWKRYADTKLKVWSYMVD